MPDIFKWPTQKGPSIDEQPNVTVVKLGDGYEQRQANGINSLLPTYSIVVHGVSGLCGKPNYAALARQFLVAKNAVESFLWTPKDTGVQGLYVCRSWNYVPTIGGLYVLTAKFEKVPS